MIDLKLKFLTLSVFIWGLIWKCYKWVGTLKQTWEVKLNMIYKAPNRKTLAFANIIHKTENTPTEVLSSRCRLCQTKQINDDTLI